MSILSWLDEEDWGVVSVVSILFGLSLTRSDTKVSDTVAIRLLPQRQSTQGEDEGFKGCGGWREVSSEITQNRDEGWWVKTWDWSVEVHKRFDESAMFKEFDGKSPVGIETRYALAWTVVRKSVIETGMHILVNFHRLTEIKV